MKPTLVIIGIICLLAAGIYWSTGCNGDKTLLHAPEIKTVDSAAIIAVAAEKATAHYRDSMAPVMALLRDTITLLKKQVRPADTVMDIHVVKLTALSDSIKALRDSSSTMYSLVDELLAELQNTGIDYQVQQLIKDSLIAKVDLSNTAKDSLQARCDSLIATLRSTLAVTQSTFKTTTAEDAKQYADLNIYKIAAKAEAVAIAALILKIALSK